MIPLLAWSLVLCFFIPVPAAVLLAVNCAMLHSIVMDGEPGRDTVMRMRRRMDGVDMKKKIVFAFNEASQTLIDNLDCEIIELADGRRIIIPKNSKPYSADTWQCKCKEINSDVRSVCYLCGAVRPY